MTIKAFEWVEVDGEEGLKIVKKLAQGKGIWYAEKDDFMTPSMYSDAYDAKEWRWWSVLIKNNGRGNGFVRAYVAQFRGVGGKVTEEDKQIALDLCKAKYGRGAG